MHRPNRPTPSFVKAAHASGIDATVGLLRELEVALSARHVHSKEFAQGIDSNNKNIVMKKPERDRPTGPGGALSCHFARSGWQRRDRRQGKWQ